MEHNVCKSCQHNNYPTCRGTIMEDGNEMNIENLRTGFKCGQKDRVNPKDFSIKVKSAIETKTDDLEARIAVLEGA